MQAVLVMFRSDGERRSFSITRDVTVIGRREDCDLRIPVGDVSRKHARMIREEEGLRIEDLGSSNGSYLNGQRIERDAVLQAGDSIQIGPVVFVLQVDGYPADDELNPITAESVESAAMLAPSAVPSAPGMEPLPTEEYETLEPLEDMGAGVGGEEPTLDLGTAEDLQLLEMDQEGEGEPAPLEDAELQPMDLEPIAEEPLSDEPLELVDDLGQENPEHEQHGLEEHGHDQHGGEQAEHAESNEPLDLDDFIIDIAPQQPGQKH